MRRFYILILIIGLTACLPNRTDPPADPEEPRAVVEANRAEVFIGPGEEVAAGETAWLRQGEHVSVGKNGRAVIYLADLLRAELFQGGEIGFQAIRSEEETITINMEQTGGVLLVDFNLDKKQDGRFILQTEYATISSRGARFLIVREGAVEWVVGLKAAADSLQVTADEVTQLVPGGTARRITAQDAPGKTVSFDTGRLEAWLANVQAGSDKLTLGELLLSPANMVGQPASLDSLPEPGQPFELTGSSVGLKLDPTGLFGSPTYRLEDCNNDGQADIFMQAGKISFDFRPALARVLSLEVTVFNRDEAGQGAVWTLGPDRQEMDRQPVTVGSGQSETLRLSSAQPYYYAELVLNRGCFLGFRLMPPAETDQLATAAETFATATPQAEPVIVNILEEEAAQPTERQQIEAVPLGERSLIQIDGRQADWDNLTRQSGLAWTSFDTITYNRDCANRYPNSPTETDLAGRVRFAYNEQYLYVAFLVEDDGYVGYSGQDQRYFLGDSPQLSLDTDLAGDQGQSQANGDDLQIDFHPGFESPQAALWRLGPLEASLFETALVDSAATDTGYFLEAALPWSDLGVSPQPGDRFGLAANINDNDTPQTENQECIISTAPQRTWNNPTTWGVLLLQEAE